MLIFDEVMTGFRVGYHCGQGYFGVTPDLTCLGKVIGGVVCRSEHTEAERTLWSALRQAVRFIRQEPYQGTRLQ
ncbi:hypothetical protein GCM10020331_034810 [Ectobacillus funiculus]